MRQTRRSEGSLLRTALGPQTRIGRALVHLALIPMVICVGIPKQGRAQTADTALGSVTTTHGEGQFTVNQNDITEFTQGSQNVILSWQDDFQQPAGHSLEFRQDSNYSILNQSPGERPSEFYGRVVCDATCIFANEAGIFFGDGSYVDVGRMFAVSGRIAEGDFLNGIHNFTHLNGPVANYGTLKGQKIALLGQNVANYGRVETPEGSFMMLAGDQVILREHDSPVVIQTHLPDSTEPASAAHVENWGEIQAQGGEVRLAAGDLLSFAIRQGETGRIAASEIVIEGGDKGLVEIGGQLDATGLESGQHGGTIDVLGEYILIADGAMLDASGAAGGGNIHVGGAQQGGEELRTARNSFVHENATIRADATESGDGGEIVIWADETTQVYGTLSARGGPSGGQGGFAETSGLDWLDVSQAPQLMARSGQAEDLGGQWLIDPNNINIVDRPPPACSPSDPSCVPCSSTDGSCLDPGLSEQQRLNPVFYDPLLWPNIEQFYGEPPNGPVLRPTVNDSNIWADLIVQTLTQGVNVWIFTDTASQTQGTQDGNIRVEAEIRIDDETVDPGTQARLVLWASNDIIVNEYIGVQRDPSTSSESPTNLALDIDLWANSEFQTENVTSPDQIPAQYQGTLELNADMETGGGSVFLLGADVVLADTGQIKTDGGSALLSAAQGDLSLHGRIDTSSDVVTEQELSRPGGLLTLAATAVRRPQNSLDDLPSVVVGGQILQTETIHTGGGNTTILSTGGRIDLNSDIDTSGGSLGLFSTVQEFESVTSEDSETVLAGGQINIGNQADLKTGGGNFAAGYVEQATAQANEITIQGRIDTSASPAAGETPQVGGTVRISAQSAFSGNDPGKIVIKANEGDLEEVLISTQGAQFLAASDGEFVLENATIDTVTELAVEAETLDSQILIQTDGDKKIIQSAQGETLLRASELVQVSYATDQAAGNLTFEGDVKVRSDQITLQAGFNSAVGEDLATVNLGTADFSGLQSPGSSLEAPTEFSLTQEADLDTSLIAGRIGGGDLSGLQTLTLSSREGTLTVSNAEQISTQDLTLNLVGAEAIVINDAFPGSPGSPTPTEPVLDTLSLNALGSLVIDSATADNISNAAQNLSITAGLDEDSSDPSLQINGNLAASESIELHGGAEGQGNLLIRSEDPNSPVSLKSQAISLWAGDGDSEGTAQVTYENVHFDKPDGSSQAFSFSLRQDAQITDETIVGDNITFGNGIDGVAGLNYTLRGDAQTDTTSSILIGTAGAQFLNGARLHLYGQGQIALEENTQLSVQTLDIGGITDFIYTDALNSNIAFTESGSVLTLRAGLSGLGNLSFESGLTIEADEIRLVAGNGPSLSGGGEFSRIDLNPESGAGPLFKTDSENEELTFLFRQDASINDEDLPDLLIQFGDTPPGQIAIRSDNGEIKFDNFTDLPLLTANQTVILSAETVTLDRQDGLHLDLDKALKVEGTTNQKLEIRTDNLALSATGLEPEDDSLAEVLPGTLVRFTGFDTQSSEAETGQPAAAFDFEATPNSAPEQIAVTQNASIGAANLIDPTSQLGQNDLSTPEPPVTFQGYSLSSLEGNIEITPESVANADLSISLQTNGETTIEDRTVLFKGDQFDLQSLLVASLFDLTIESQTSNDLILVASDNLNIQSGLSGVGDLGFSGNVTLQANTILLSAGDDPAAREASSPSPSTSLVKANDLNAGSAFSLTFKMTEKENAPTSFTLVQARTLANSGIDDPDAPTFSLIPDQSQFEFTPAPGSSSNESLGILSLASIDGDLEITNLFNNTGESIYKTDQIVLSAGYLGSPSDHAVKLKQEDGQDFNARAYETFIVLAPHIEFTTRGGGVIQLDDVNTPDSRVLLFGGIDFLIPENTTSPLRLLIQQDASFDDSEDCSTGCLPNAYTQFGPSGVESMEYTLASKGTDTSILIDDAIAQKIFLSNLTLDAPNVTFAIESPRALDALFESLTVGLDPTTPIQIRFQGDQDNPLTLKTIFDQTYNGNVILDGSTQLSGRVIQFSDTLEADDSSGHEQNDELTVLTDDQVRFFGDIGQSQNSRIELLRILFQPVSNGTPNAVFGDGSSYNSFVTAETLEFFNSDDLDATSSDPIRVPTTATISKLNGDLTIDTGTFTMGMGEKLSVQGNLYLTATEQATLGDLSAIEMTVTSQLIEILRRTAGQFLTASAGLLPDAGVDYVANLITFQDLEAGSPNLKLTGSGANPIFGLQDPSNIPDWMKAFSTFQIQTDALPLNVSDFNLPDYTWLADLHPEGASRDDPSTLYFNQAIPPRPSAWNPSSWIPFNRASVEELDINAEPMTPRAYKSQLMGATLIDNVGTNFTAWDGKPLEVSDARIDGTEAAQAVALMHELFGPRGKRAVRVREVLQNALDQYQRNTGARRIIGFELRRYVKNRPSSLFEAYQTLEDLDLLFGMHRSLGLTPGEYRPIQRRWLDVIRPDGISTLELAEAIHPSQYVRGSDVLDIFGD